MSHAIAKPAVLLAKPYTKNMAARVHNYYLSEKYDGLRGWWTGKEMVSRLGKPFNGIPPWWVRSLPKNIVLDGEIWMGRGSFHQVVSLARKAANAADEEDGGKKESRWKKARFLVFDMPELTEAPFERRLAELQDVVKDLPYAQLVTQVNCRGLEHFNSFLHDVVSNGGEGVMLRQKASLYEGKRSATLLKHKLFEDAEVRVEGYTSGEGKYTGMVGALQCILPNAVRVRVGSGLTDEDRLHPPPIGATVTIRYNGFTPDGVPLFPRFVAVRDDIEPVVVVGGADTPPEEKERKTKKT